MTDLFAILLAVAMAASVDDPPPTPAPDAYTPALLIKQVDPRPPKWLQMSVPGVIRACFTITEKGKVTDVYYPAGKYIAGAFDEPIRHALVRWRYEPAKRFDKPVESKGCADFHTRLIGG